MNENTFSNKVSKKPTAQKKSLFNCQRNLPVTLLWKTKKIHFGNINEKDVTDNNFFGNLSNHSNWISKVCEKITLVEDDYIVTKDDKAAKTQFFSNAVKIHDVH